VRVHFVVASLAGAGCGVGGEDFVADLGFLDGFLALGGGDGERKRSSFVISTRPTDYSTKGEPISSSWIIPDFWMMLLQIPLWLVW